MGIRDAVRRLLERGVDNADPNEHVELIVLPISKGPMALSALQAAGIDAVGDDAYSVITDLATNFRILVPRGQVAQANAILDDAL